MRLLTHRSSRGFGPSRGLLPVPLVARKGNAMKRLLLLLAIAALALFVGAPVAASPPLAAFDHPAQLDFAPPPVELAAATVQQVSLADLLYLDTSVPGAKRIGLAVSFFEDDFRPSAPPSPPARAVPRREVS